MVSKSVKCPKCGNIVEISGNPGEKVFVTCSKCGEKGSYLFPKVQTDSKSTEDSSIIKVTNLSKLYGKFKAVDSVSFNVKKGEIFGFLGPNGAGKTTTIKAILALIHVNSGEIKINGVDIRKNEKIAKKYIGYLPEQVAFYNNLTALQNLRFYAEMKNASKEECKELIEEFGLGESINKKVGKFSKGMIQRLGMARAILGSPPILILDEPSGGLDPRGVMLIRNKIRELRNNGATIFVSSHILSEIQEVCDRVGIIDKAVLVAKDTVSGLSSKLNLKPKITIELETLSKGIIEAVKKVTGVDSVESHDKILDIVCESGTKAKVILAIEKAGGNIINLQTKEPSLEEVFMKYTGG